MRFFRRRGRDRIPVFGNSVLHGSGNAEDRMTPEDWMTPAEFAAAMQPGEPPLGAGDATMAREAQGGTVASHFSAGKPGVDQIPVDALLEWGRVYTYGEAKYGRDNWRKGLPWHEFYGSILRHLFKWWDGEDIDPESHLPHMAHALWNVGALMHFQANGIGTDDRPVGPQMAYIRGDLTEMRQIAEDFMRTFVEPQEDVQDVQAEDTEQAISIAPEELAPACHCDMAQEPHEPHLARVRWELPSYNASGEVTNSPYVILPNGIEEWL